MRSDFSLNRQVRKQTEGSRRERSLQRTSSPGRDSGGKAKKQKTNKSEINKGQPHIIRVRQERQPHNKQRKTTQIVRQGQGQRVRHKAEKYVRVLNLLRDKKT